LLVDRTATSMDEYARYGGIIPEIASRAHLESFLPTLDAALDEAGVPLADVDAIAVAAGPGLVGSLTVGICAAKALASSLGKPLYGVNHVIGHLAVDKLALGHALFRIVAMVDDDDRAEEITLVIVGNVVEEVLPVALGPGVLALVARHIKHEG